MKILITWVFIGLSIYFFSDDSYLWGLIFGVLALYRIFGKNTINTNLFSNTTKTSEKILNTNVSIDLSLNIENILKHKKTRKALERLKGKDLVEYKDQDEFIAKLCENFKAKYKKEHSWDKTLFNIKNNLLWKDKEIDFRDTVYHEILVAFDSKNKDDGFSLSQPGISIRALIINGVIKVQIGRFRKETTPHILRDGGLAAYVEWETITTFPLMYTSFNIPERFLMLSYQATDSYRDRFIKDGEAKDMFKDWNEITTDVRDYNKIFSLNDDDEVSTEVSQVMSRLIKKGQEILEKENFVDPYKRDDTWYTPPWMEIKGVNYNNDYMNVSVTDLNEYRNDFKDYYATDWYEETP